MDDDGNGDGGDDGAPLVVPPIDTAAVLLPADTLIRKPICL